MWGGKQNQGFMITSFDLNNFFTQGYNNMGFNKKGDFKPNANQLYRLVTMKDPKLALTISQNKAEQNKAILSHYEGKPWQLFYVHENPKGSKDNHLQVLFTTPEGNSIRVKQASKDNGAEIRVRERKNADHQIWNLQPVTDKKHSGKNAFVLVSAVSNKCLDYHEGKAVEGANCFQWELNGGENQMWQIIPYGIDLNIFDTKLQQTKVKWQPNPYQVYKLVPHKDNKLCLSPSGDDNKTWLHPWGAKSGEQFYIHELPHKTSGKDLTVTFTTIDGERLKVRKGDKDSGVDVIINEAKNKPNEIWIVNQHPTIYGAFYIKSQVSGKALCFDGGVCEKGRRCFQWDYHGKEDQIWHILPVEGTGMINMAHKGFNIAFDGKGGYNQGFNQW